jgi:hypothetical protein
MIVRILSNYVSNEKLFYANEEYDMYDRYKTLLTEEIAETLDIPYEENKHLYIYRIRIDATFYPIPESSCVMIEKHTNTETKEMSYKEKWDNETHEDELAKDGDYVKASKNALGIDISPYDTPDKCDYANQHLLPEWLRRKK